MQRALITMIAISYLAGGAVDAASSPIPSDVTAYVDMMKQECKDAGGTPIAPADTFLQSGHFRDADHEDWVIDEGGFNCDGAASYFSGSGGAQVEIFVSLQGNKARQAFQSGADGVSLEHRNGLDVLWLNVGGPLCGQTGDHSLAEAVECKRPLVWNNTTGEFEFAPLSTIQPYRANTQ